MEIINRKYKEFSHQSIEKIKEMQHRHARDLIQPRDSDGELNPDFVREYGAKNLNITSHDVNKMAHKSINLAKKLDDHRRTIESNQSNQS